MATQPLPIEDPLTNSAPALTLGGFVQPDAPDDKPAPVEPHHVPGSHAVRAEDAARSEDGHTARANSFDSSPFGTAPQGVIGRHKPRDVIRIERSYEAGEICQFWPGFPPEFEGRHVRFMNELNTVLADANNPYKNVADNCVAVMSLYLSTFFLPSHFERQMKRLYDIIDTANREIYMPAGLRVLDPRPVAFLFLLDHFKYQLDYHLSTSKALIMALIGLSETILPAISLVFLVPAFILNTLPIFSAPFTAKLAYYPEGYSTTGFVFGIWGGCRLSVNAADRACTSKIWGYNLSMQDVALPAAAGIRGNFTRALGVILPFASIFCLIALVFSIFSLVRAYRISRRRSLPSSEKTGISRDGVKLATAGLTFLAFAFSAASVGVGYHAFNSARVNINLDTGLNMAFFKNMFWASVATVPLVFVTLVLQILAIVRHSQIQSMLRRESPSKKVPKLGYNYDVRPEVDDDRKWHQFVDEDDK